MNQITMYTLCTPYINTMLYLNYISIKLGREKQYVTNSRILHIPSSAVAYIIHEYFNKNLTNLSYNQRSE